VRPIASSGKTDITKVGLNSIENDVVKSNLMGKSRVMGKKGWVDPQGRKGKGYGVYKVRSIDCFFFAGACFDAADRRRRF
jgi:photosystem II 10kDa protein